MPPKNKRKLSTKKGAKGPSRKKAKIYNEGDLANWAGTRLSEIRIGALQNMSPEGVEYKEKEFRECRPVLDGRTATFKGFHEFYVIGGRALSISIHGANMEGSTMPM